MKKNSFTTQLILLNIFLIANACKKVKNNEIDATIYVKQFQTHAPIANAKVIITRGPDGGSTGSETVETIFTDNQGKCTFDNTIDNNYSHYAQAEKDGFITDNQQVDLINGEKNFTTTIFKYAESYVKLHLKNISPINQYDLIKFNSGCYTYSYQGIIDTTFLWCDNCNCAWFGDFSFQAGAFVTKNNINATQQFSFTPIPHDTITIDINY